MSLPFYLTSHRHLSSSLADDRHEGYSMIGGPLQRSWTLFEWRLFVKRQPAKEQEFYKKWAEEADKNPHNEIARDLE